MLIKTIIRGNLLTRAVLVIHAKRPAQLVLCGLAGAHICCQNKLLVIVILVLVMVMVILVLVMVMVILRRLTAAHVRCQNKLVPFSLGPSFQVCTYTRG